MEGVNRQLAWPYLLDMRRLNAMKIVCDWQHCGHSTALFSHGVTALGGGCWRVCAVAQLWQMTLVKEVGSKITPKQPSSPLHLTCFILLQTQARMFQNIYFAMCCCWCCVFFAFSELFIQYSVWSLMNDIKTKIR